MANSNSGKHARKVTLDAAVNNAIEKAVDARKVAAFTVGAAGVLAGAAFAFGATPAMAAEAGVAPDTKPTPVTAGENAGADKKADGKDTTKSDKAKETETEDAAKQEQTEQTNKQDNDKESNNTVTTDDNGDESTVVNKRTKRSLGSNQTEPTKDAKAENQDRASSGTTNQDPNKIKPAAQADGSTKIEINENNAETMPNAYGWGSSDNTYSVNGEKHTVTFHFAAPKNGGKITNIAIFPAQNNGLTNDKSKRGAEYYSGDPKMHQSFSGNYTFTPSNQDGSATLTMSDLFRNGNIGAAEKYAANRSIFVYVTAKDGTTTIYKTNAFRAATLVPPKTAGSVVLKYNQELTPEKVQAAITAAANAETARGDKKSVNDQLAAASASNGVFTRENGKAVRVTDTTDGKINVSSEGAYDKTTFEAINTKKTGDTNSYIAGAKTLNTYMVTDLGFKSGAIPLTVARYDDRIDKPIVEDPTKVSEDVKTEIKKKLAKINGVSTDKITFDGDNAVIHFDGVDEKDAPKIALRDLVLKKFTEDQIKVPAESTATVIYNPLAYSDAEIKSIKKAIYEANKDKTELGLSATDYENQITLSYLTGNLTATGDSNKGISNGQAENTITVKIKTDKAVAEFKSDVKAHKLTRLADIRKDYNVSWKQNKIDGRDSDEGLSWSEDGKTIIYRYDPTAAKEFDTNKILDLLKATAKDKNSGLRDLTGNEKLDHEGVDGKAKKSHVGYVIDKNGQPTTELSLGNMSGAYWQYSQKVDNSGVDLGDNLSEAGSYSWDNEAKPVFVAAKKGKVYKARLFVLPYGLTMYRNVYMENSNQPWNTPKAINVIFVPQTNHKTSDLKKSVDDHKTTQIEGNDVPTQSAYYNASDKKKEAYDKALQTAKDLYESVKDTEESKLTEQQKAQIDNATINLNKARAELDGAKTDKNGLTQSIEANGKAAEGANPASGTQATDRYKNVTEPDFKTPDGKADEARNNAAKEAKKAYDKALEDAKTLKEDDNATQKDVDAAKAKLDAAREKLNEFTTNKDELNNAIAQHGHVNTGRDAQGAQTLAKADPTYQNSSKAEQKAYDDAVAQADKVSKDPNASQKEVNEAIKKLKDAKSKLDAKATDKSKLAAAEKQSFDNPSNDESKQSVFYKNALNKQTNGADETEKQAAKTAIDNYNNALTNARTILNNEKATQAQVNEAKQKLEEAEKALHEGYKSDDNDLTKAIANNVSGYLMPAYFNAFDQAQKDGADSQAAKDFKAYNDAYQKAKELSKKLKETEESKKPKQTEIDDAKTALEDARKVIDKYATDTSKISAALLHSLAIKASPAYKNASATDATEDAKNAAKAYDDALTELQKAFNDQMDKDRDDDGNEISESVIPDKDIDMNDKNALKKLQAHAKGQPLNRDVTKLLEKLNKAVADLNKFATKTDALLKSVNEDDATHQNPAFKNASHPDYKNESGQADTDKNGKASKAVDDYGAALNKAKELLKNPAATQKEVNDALKKLDEARKALDAYNTDTAKLVESVKKHGDTEGTAPTEGTQTSDAYRNASDPHFMKDQDGKLVPDTDKNTKAAAAKKAYDEALTKAQELLKKHDSADTPQDAKPTQAEINDALKALDEARTKLDDYKTNAEALKDEAAKSTADGSIAGGTDFENMPEFKNADAKKGEDNKDNDDVKAYKYALKNARDLVKAATEQGKKNSERPTQQQINDALEALKNAKKQITDNYKTDAAALKDAKDFANGAFKKTPEYKNAVALKDDASAAPEKKNTAKADVDALDKNTNDSALEKAIEILRAFDDNGNPKQEGPTGGRIPTQKEVDEALQTLQKAMDKVTNGYKTNADKLKNEVGDKDEKGNKITPPFEASVAYKNALEKAKTEEDKTSDDSATKKLEDYNKKLKAAQDLIAQVNSTDPNADPDKKPTQAQVDKALSDLQNAKKAIDEKFKTKVDDLQKEVDDKDNTGATKVPDIENTTEFANLKAKIDGANKPDDLVAYEQALAKAKELIDKNDGKVKNDQGVEVDVPKDQLPTQKEVDEAKKALKEIKDKILKNYVTSPHDLQQEVDKSKDGDTDTDTSTDLFENTPAFKNAQAKGDEAANKALDAYTEKLKAAKKLLDAFDRTTGKVKDPLPQGVTQAPTQKELDDALKALQDAKKKIEDNYSTVKSDLRQEAGKDSYFTKSPEYQNAQAKGDDESKQALDEYKKALEDANKVLGDKNATQAQVDEALKKLQDAKKKLTDSNKTDKSKLQTEADADAKFRKSVYFIIGNKDDIEAYKKALAEADSVLNDPNATQAQVDEALRKLQAAKYKINHPFGVGSGVGSGSGYDTDADAGDGFDTSDSQSASVDKSALQLEVNNSEADSSAASKANTDAARAYVSALAEAKRVLADKNATQAQVDEALRKLQAAKAAWRNASGASGNASALAKTGAATGLFASLAAVFSGLGAAGVASRRRKHSNE